MMLSIAYDMTPASNGKSASHATDDCLEHLVPISRRWGQTVSRERKTGVYNWKGGGEEIAAGRMQEGWILQSRCMPALILSIFFPWVYTIKIGSTEAAPGLMQS